MIAAEVVDFVAVGCVVGVAACSGSWAFGSRAALFGGALGGSTFVRFRRNVHRGATASCGFGHRVLRSTGIRVRARSAPSAAASFEVAVAGIGLIGVPRFVSSFGCRRVATGSAHRHRSFAGSSEQVAGR
jgi:hypothetical protein